MIPVLKIYLCIYVNSTHICVSLWLFSSGILNSVKSSLSIPVADGLTDRLGTYAHTAPTPSIRLTATKVLCLILSIPMIKVVVLKSGVNTHWNNRVNTYLYISSRSSENQYKIPNNRIFICICIINPDIIQRKSCTRTAGKSRDVCRIASILPGMSGTLVSWLLKNGTARTVPMPLS